MQYFQHKISISQKLALILLLTAVASMSIIGALYHLRSQTIMYELIQQHLRVVASQVEIQVKMAIQLNAERLSLIKSRTQLRRSLRNVLNENDNEKSDHLKKISAILHDAKNSVSDIKTMKVTDLNGKVVQTTDPGLINADIDLTWLRKDAGDNSMKIKVIDNGRNINLRFGDVLQIDGNVLGYIIVDVDTSSFEHALFNQSGNSSLEVILYHYNDTVAPVPLLLSQKLKYQSEISSFNLRQYEVSQPGEILELKATAATPKLGIVRPLNLADWGLLLRVNKQDALKPMTEQSSFLILAAVIVSFLLFFTSLSIGRRITKPIVDMAYVAHMISGGDFSRRINTLSEDELGTLGESLNKMADFLIHANQELDKKVREKTVELHIANEHLLELNEELERITQIDALTQIYNRRAFDNTLKKEIKRTSRDRTPLTLFLLDVDFFKKYNDSIGHSEGDRCLITLATTLKNTVKRDTDFVARYGGEEFAILLPNTDAEAAEKIAISIQQMIAQQAIPHPDSAISAHVTVSIGIAVTRYEAEITEKKLIEQADIALYKAKGKGRNCFVLYSE